MIKSKKQVKTEPTMAPGLNDQDLLEENATKKEVEKGEYTSVTTLSYDEVDRS